MWPPPRKVPSSLGKIPLFQWNPDWWKLLLSQIDRSYRTRMIEVLALLVHRWSLVYVWALWCLPDSTASGFRFLTSDVAKQRQRLWVRLEIGWRLMTVFPRNTCKAATQMNNTLLGCSRRWQSAGSRDLSYMHVMELAIVSWPRRCRPLSSTHDNPVLAHRLYPCVSYHDNSWHLVANFSLLGPQHCCVCGWGHWLMQRTCFHEL